MPAWSALSRQRHNDRGSDASLGEQVEWAARCGWDRSEVTPVKGHEKIGAQPLGQGDHGRVRAAEREIAVAMDQVGDPDPVLACRCLYLEDSQPAQEGGRRPGSEPSTHQVRDLGHDESWHDEVELDSGKDLDAACVVVIIGVPAAYSGPESTIAIIAPLDGRDRVDVPGRGPMTPASECDERQLATHAGVAS